MAGACPQGQVKSCPQYKVESHVQEDKKNFVFFKRIVIANFIVYCSKSQIFFDENVNDELFILSVDFAVIAHFQQNIYGCYN